MCWMQNNQITYAQIWLTITVQGCDISCYNQWDLFLPWVP